MASQRSGTSREARETKSSCDNCRATLVLPGLPRRTRRISGWFSRRQIEYVVDRGLLELQFPLGVCIATGGGRLYSTLGVHD